MAGGLCLGPRGYYSLLSPANRSCRLPRRLPVTALGGLNKYCEDWESKQQLVQCLVCGLQEGKERSWERLRTSWEVFQRTQIRAVEMVAGTNHFCNWRNLECWPIGLHLCAHESRLRHAHTLRRRGDVEQQSTGLFKQIGIWVAVGAAVLWFGGIALPITSENLLFLEAWRAVDRAYVDKSFNGQNWFKVREQALKNTPMRNQQETYLAIKQLLSSLNDPYTKFFEPAQFDALKGGEKGSVTGVGVEVGYDMMTRGEPKPMLVTPIPDGPAARSGIVTGDQLLAIDGDSTVGSSLYEAGVRLQGKQGSKVVLTVKTGGKAPRDVTVVREKVRFNPVTSTLCSGVNPRVGEEGLLGYIAIAKFSEQTPPDVGRAVKELKERGARRLLIDIRNNGGGSFAAGVELAKQLLGSGDIVLIADSEGVRDIYSADGGPLDSTTPIAVIVNKGTASASEVFAGAIQDNHRGLIVGQRTFGKGLIQTLIPFSDGSGAAVTVAKYQTPSGRDINRVGILPDRELSDDVLSTSRQDICEALKADDAPALY